MTSPQLAVLRHRLTEIRAHILELERRAKSAQSATEKADAELLASFHRSAERNAANEIQLYDLVNKIASLTQACANPERFVTKAPPPPHIIGDRVTRRVVPPREELIEWKRAELRSELQKVKARKSDLETVIARWHKQELSQWEKILKEIEDRLPGYGLAGAMGSSRRYKPLTPNRAGKKPSPDVAKRRTIVRANLAAPNKTLCRHFDAHNIPWSGDDEGDFPGWVRGLASKRYGSKIQTMISKDKKPARS